MAQQPPPPGPGPGGSSLMVRLLGTGGGTVTATNGGRAEATRLRDDGKAPDPRAGDGLWCGAMPLHGEGPVTVTLQRDDEVWQGVFEPEGDMPELVLRAEQGGTLVEIDLGAMFISPDVAVSPWSVRPSPRPPYARLLLIGSLCLLGGAGIRQLR